MKNKSTESNGQFVIFMIFSGNHEPGRDENKVVQSNHKGLGLISVFNSIPTSIGYLIPKPSL